MFKTLASITCLLCISAIAHAADVETLDLEPIAISLDTAGDSGGVDYKDCYQDSSDCSCKTKAECCCHCPIVPSMIGDGGLITPRLDRGLPDVTPAFQDHIYKVAENNSPIPQDRIGFNYNFLHHVYNGTLDGLRVNDDLSEYRLFAEKTLFCDRLSVDLMIPFYTTSRYDPGVDLLDVGPETDEAFGDIAFGMKYLLHRSESGALSAGLRVEAPTNDEIRQTDVLLNNVYTSIDDDVWHFTPYAALLLTPSDRFFVQSFLSYRLNSGSLEREAFGPIREQTYLMADLSAGYWIYRNPCNRGLTGIVPTVELHYTGAFDEEDPASTITNTVFGKTDVLNLTAGVTALINDRTSVAVGVAVPLRDNPYSLPFTTSTVGTDRRYDWALMVNMNYYFGR